MKLRLLVKNVVWSISGPHNKEYRLEMPAAVIRNIIFRERWSEDIKAFIVERLKLERDDEPKQFEVRFSIHDDEPDDGALWFGVDCREGADWLWMTAIMNGFSKFKKALN